MLRIKRLYTFVLGTFLPLLAATFSVCLFILLMQFLWQYVNDMVGKGVGLTVLAELFFYASLSFTPMALPLSILLASLMTFGNLGEHLELLAMKASGISLIRIMKPLIFFVILLVGISFVFQNNIVPRAHTKMYTMVLSLRQKSPELDIPEGSFYKEITGYNVYVRNKDKKTGVLRNMMIYDYSQGFENAVIIVSDSGRLNISADKKYLILTLYNGESFQNLEKRKTRSVNEKTRYRRETFALRDILIEFDTNFNMADESIMGNRDVGKNLNELTSYVDSVQKREDSINVQNIVKIRHATYGNILPSDQEAIKSENINTEKIDSLFSGGFEEYFNNLSYNNKISYLQASRTKADQIKNENTVNTYRQIEVNDTLRSHRVQVHRKFSVALSCLLFFFIGAPLGAIIRKGGLGMPAVISVLLFLLYWTIDTFGTKMAKQGVWEIWQGAWLSTSILAALGIFFTYKAVNDSTMMNADAWKNFFQKLIGKKAARNYSVKDVIMTPPDYLQDINEMERWNEKAELYLKEHKKPPFYFSFWKEGFHDKDLKNLKDSMDKTIEDLLNSDESLLVGKLMDYPMISVPRMSFLNNTIVKWFCAIIFPIGLLIYLLMIYRQNHINKDINTIKKINDSLITEIKKLKL